MAYKHPRSYIAVHRKLHDAAAILHGDISPNTIVIMENPTDGKVEGALIDFDKPLTFRHKYLEPHMSGSAGRVITI